MIQSFGCKHTEALHRQGKWGKGAPFPQDICSVARRKLASLNAATDKRDLNLRGNNLEKLEQLGPDTHSIRVNDQWRVVFDWTDQNAHDVRIVDYH